MRQTIANMPPDEASYHMKRCVDSGLWVPDAKDRSEHESELDTEPTYEDTGSPKKE